MTRAVPKISGATIAVETVPVAYRMKRDLGAAGTDPEFGAGVIDPPATLRGVGLAR